MHYIIKNIKRRLPEKNVGFVILIHLYVLYSDLSRFQIFKFKAFVFIRRPLNMRIISSGVNKNSK